MVDSVGGVTGAIEITPDHITQSHKFVVSCDQTYIKPLIADCNKVLSDYPIKGRLA
jgi:hypothetical protein